MPKPTDPNLELNPHPKRERSQDMPGGPIAKQLRSATKRFFAEIAKSRILLEVIDPDGKNFLGISEYGWRQPKQHQGAWVPG